LLPTVAGKKRSVRRTARTLHRLLACRPSTRANGRSGPLVVTFARNLLPGFVKTSCRDQASRTPHSVKLFGDRFARAGIVQGLQALHVFHPGGSFSGTVPSHPSSDPVVDNNRRPNWLRSMRSSFGCQDLPVHGKPFAWRKSRRALMAFRRAAVDLAGEKAARSKDWSLRTQDGACLWTAPCLSTPHCDRAASSPASAGRRDRRAEPILQASASRQSPKHRLIRSGRIGVPFRARQDHPAGPFRTCFPAGGSPADAWPPAPFRYNAVLTDDIRGHRMAKSGLGSWAAASCGAACMPTGASTASMSRSGLSQRGATMSSSLPRGTRSRGPPQLSRVDRRRRSRCHRICTPPNLHPRMIVEAMQAGKHVICTNLPSAACRPTRPIACEGFCRSHVSRLHRLDVIAACRWAACRCR